MDLRALSPTKLVKRGSYFESSRAPRYSLVFALPLLLAYEGLAAVLAGPGRASQVRNGADVLLKQVFISLAGPHGPLVFIAAVIGLSVWFVARDLKRSGQRLQPRVFGTMLGESMLLAALFGIVIGTVTVKLMGSLHMLMVIAPETPQRLSDFGWPTRLMLSLGAGLYEELLFRVLLVSALAAGARSLFGWSLRAAGVFAAVAGALVFSAFHYVGPYGDPFEMQSFVFRAISGLAFSALYLLRGFGITAWTHALYDAYLLLL